MAELPRRASGRGDRHRLPSDRRSAEAFNPNVVKVVLDRDGYALYFSRATIPWARDAFADWASRGPARGPAAAIATTGSTRTGRRFLRPFPGLAPAPIERFEALEQLRALWHGYRIVVEVTHGTPAPGIDTPEDLERVRALFAGRADDSADRRRSGSSGLDIAPRLRHGLDGSTGGGPRKVARPAAPFSTTNRRSHDHATDTARPARRRQGNPGRFHHQGATAFRRSPPATCCARRSRPGRRLESASRR